VDTAIDPTNYIAQMCSASSCISYSLGMAAETSNWHRARVFSDQAGHVKFQLDSSTILDGCSGCANLNQAPSANARKPMSIVRTRAAAGKQIYLDKNAFKWTGRPAI
jgi:hypothetical protein